jgi:hypothetical protein
MKTVRIAALGVLMTGILFMQGPSAPNAVGQQPGVERPGTPYNPFGGVSFVPNGPADLAHQYAKATKEEEKKEIRVKLADSLNKEFDELARRQQAELDQLEKQVENLKVVLKKRKDSKSAIVERRLEQLIQDAEGLGWGSANRQIPVNDLSNPQTR